MNNSPAYADQITYLIEHIRTPIDDRRTQLQTVELQLADLEEAGICTGTVYWRDGTSTRPKMYVNHGVGESCPVHGQPKPHGRIRHYVGTKQDKQAEAKAAIDRWNEHRELEREHHGLVQVIEGALDTLQDFYRDLGYSVPPFPPDEPPTPQPNWNPARHYRRHYRW